MANAFRTNIPLPVCAIGITAVCRVATLVARGRYGQEIPQFAFFNPFPLRDFPYLTTFAGAEKVTLRLTEAEKYIFAPLCCGAI